MNLSPQQSNALKAVLQWIKDGCPGQVFYLYGWAGTGKTTLAKIIAEEIPGHVGFAAFSGKAAQVLRNKGCGEASTLHSLIYKAEQDEATGEVTFQLNATSPLSMMSALITDECSMVGRDLGADLLSYGVPIIVLGDPEQLPPVDGSGFFMTDNPHVMLTEIHRQAADNPIIRMSIDIREGRRLMPGAYGESRVLLRRDTSRDELREIILGADQILCGKNATRTMFNARVRELRGFAGIKAPHHPCTGEKLICLKNDYAAGFFNGSMWQAGKVKAKNSGKLTIALESLEGGASFARAEVWQNFFDGTEKSVHWKDLKKTQQFTYGHVITVHKAQGSQWPAPVIFDESHVFREDARKHLYTAVTRASERVTVII